MGKVIGSAKRRRFHYVVGTGAKVALARFGMRRLLEASGRISQVFSSTDCTVCRKRVILPVRFAENTNSILMAAEVGWHRKNMSIVSNSTLGLSESI